METQIGKWGNSLGVRIPALLASELGLKEGSTLDMQLVRDGLLLKRSRTDTLASLVAGITPANLHGESDWGNPKGAEDW